MSEAQPQLQQHEDAIEKWFRLSIENGGLDRQDELHVDQVDTRWSSRAQWIPAGLRIFAMAVRIRERRQEQLTVALSLSVKGSTRPKGANFATLQELELELAHIPPSLYLFRPGTEPWFVTGQSIERVDHALFPNTYGLRMGLHLEFKPRGDQEFLRTIFLAG